MTKSFHERGATLINRHPVPFGLELLFGLELVFDLVPLLELLFALEPFSGLVLVFALDPLFDIELDPDLGLDRLLELVFVLGPLIEADFVPDSEPFLLIRDALGLLIVSGSKASKQSKSAQYLNIY